MRESPGFFRARLFVGCALARGALSRDYGERVDLLSSLLREMRLESVAYRRLELGAPWSVTFEQTGVRAVHIVVSGRCELSFGEDARVLSAGDLVLAPRADRHTMRSLGRPRVPAVPSLELIRGQDGGVVHGGGPGEETVIVCGAFFFHAGDHPALAALPRLIHIVGSEGRASEWIRAYVDALTTEVLASGPGSDVVMARLSDALVARALRFHAESEESGWLGALRDPPIARALAAMHDDLARAWTLPALAKIAGVSRSVFVDRFRSTVGETPMQHLLRRRMRRAMALLDDGVTLASAAARVGYASEPALAVAFKRHTGVTPGAYRRRAIRGAG